MSSSMRVAFWCYFIALLLMGTFGVIYLIKPEFMPYHAEAVGMNWSSVDVGFQIMILGLMKSHGAACLGMVISFGALLVKPFREGQIWVKYVLPFVSYIYTIPALYVTLNIRAKTGAHTPWIAVVAGMVLVALGFVFSIYGGGHKLQKIDL